MQLTFTKVNLHATSTEMLVADAAGNFHVTDGTMLTKISELTGKVTAMLLGIDLPDFVADYQRWEAGALIQNAFPTLNADEREFVKTGITPTEWKEAFGDFEEE